MNKVLRGEEALRKLINEWGLPEAYAKRNLEVAAEHGVNVTNSGNMGSVVTITRLGRNPFTFSLTEGVPSQKDSRKKIPPRGTRASRPGYTSGSENVGTLATRAGGRAGQTANRRDTAMPKAAAETVAEEEATDLTAYLEKDITPTVNDYIDFLVEELGEKAEIDERSVYYAITLYKYFQGSDFSRERKEARRAEREAARAAKASENGAAEEGEGEEKPAARRGRKPAVASEAPADKAPARRGRPATKPAAGASGAPRRRGRPAAAAKGEPAPY